MEECVIFIIGIIIGVINSISGGAGIFAMPVLALLGFPFVQIALLNKSADIVSILGTVNNYAKKSKFLVKDICYKSSIFLTIGTIIGTHLIFLISGTLLKTLIPIAVLVAVLFNLVKSSNNKNKVKEFNYSHSIIFLAIGVWGGLFGIAGFTMTSLVFIRLYGFSFLLGIANALFVMLPGIIISWSYLVLKADYCILQISVIMLGAFIGGHIGSALSLKKGSGFVKKSMITMALIICSKLVFDLAIN